MQVSDIFDYYKILSYEQKESWYHEYASNAHYKKTSIVPQFASYKWIIDIDEI